MISPTLRHAATAIAALIAALLIVGLTPAASAATVGRIVDCDQGHSLARAVRRAPPGTTIRVRGTCHEQVVIRKDRIRLVGDANSPGGAGIDGHGVTNQNAEFNALVTVRDAVGVRLDRLFVRNGPAEGVLVSGQASVLVRHVNVHNNLNVGMLVDGARVEIKDSAFTGNLSGYDSTNNASTILRGDIGLTDNALFGLAASNGAALELRGGKIDASGNGAFGIIVESGYLSIFNFGVSQGSQILANRNGFLGIGLVTGGTIDVIAPGPLQNSGINLVEATENVIGVLMQTGSRFDSPFGAATINVQRNAVGMQVGGNSDLNISGGLHVTSNGGPGLVADGAGRADVRVDHRRAEPVGIGDHGQRPGSGCDHDIRLPRDVRRYPRECRLRPHVARARPERYQPLPLDRTTMRPDDQRSGVA